MIDGIAINNPLFGNNSIDLNALAVQQVNFQRGGLDPVGLHPLAHAIGDMDYRHRNRSCNPVVHAVHRVCASSCPGG